MKYVVYENYDIALDVLDEIKYDFRAEANKIAEEDIFIKMSIERIIECIIDTQHLIRNKRYNLYQDIKKKKLEIIEYAFNKISNAEAIKYKIIVEIIKDNLDNPLLRVIACNKVYILEVSGYNIYFYLLSAGKEAGFIIPLNEWDAIIENSNTYQKDVYTDEIINRLKDIIENGIADVRTGKNILDLRYYDASKVNKSYNDIFYDLTSDEVTAKIRTAIESGNLLEFVLNGKTFNADSYSIGVGDLIV